MNKILSFTKISSWRECAQPAARLRKDRKAGNGHLSFSLNVCPSYTLFLLPWLIFFSGFYYYLIVTCLRTGRMQ